MNLKQILIVPLKAVPNSLVIVALVIALAGFVDASYLTIEHYQNAIPPCSIGSCETVLSSAYSTVLGIPVSLMGAIYYLIVMVGFFAYLEGKKVWILEWTLRLGTLGFLASLWFVYLQLFVLHAICVYCMGSATSSTLLFVCSIVVFSKYRAAINHPNETIQYPHN